MRLYSRMEPVGWTYHADIYCASCGDGLPSVDPEGNEKHPVFGWDELAQEIEGQLVWQACGTCGETADNW